GSSSASGLRGGSKRQHGGAKKHHESPGYDRPQAPRFGATKFAKEQPAPENSKQTIQVPQRKCDAEADVADCVNGQRIGHRPEATCQNTPKYQMRRLPGFYFHLLGAANQRGQRPAREKDAANHE